MNVIADLTPRAPDWRLDWDEIDARFEWIRALEACPQSPEYRGEGNVWIHTRMVLEALADSPTWRARPAPEREMIFAACLLHDVAKPETTRTEPDGRITARHHSERGALRARRILWEFGLEPTRREVAAHLVLHHQLPFYLIDRDRPERVACRISHTCGASPLAEVARADIRGRIASDGKRLLDNISLFEELCRDLDCLDRPRAFPSPAHRVAYFADASRTFDAHVAPLPTAEVIVMAGLPASGKDHWIEHDGPGWPVVSLDDVRRELGIAATGEQGLVVQTCRERARVHLRAGRSFIWNGTNLSRCLRGQVLGLCHRYGAHTRVVHLETAPTTWRDRNGARRHPVPESALEKMLGRWEVPDDTEAHRVELLVT